MGELIDQLTQAEPLEPVGVDQDESPETIEFRRFERMKESLLERGFPARHVAKLGCLHGPGLIKANEISPMLKGTTTVLCGDRGPGKTQMACHWALNYDRPRYFKAHDLIRAIRGEFSDDDERRKRSVVAMKDALFVDFLVIDEFAELAGSDYDRRTLTNIIDHRYDDMKTTVLITNAKPEKLADEMGRSIFSRCSEAGGVVHCDWKSYR